MLALLLIPFVTFAEDSNNNKCDMTVEDSVCIYNGSTVISSPATPSGLVGHWSFDDNLGLDQSGNSNHAKSGVTAGPASGGFGTAAYFTGYNYMEISPNEIMDLETFTFTFWLYIHKDSKIESHTASGNQWCPILQKGEDNKDQDVYARTPAIFLDRLHRQLRVNVSTTHADTPQGENALSVGRLHERRWTHITAMRKENRIRIYINGMLDTDFETEGTTEVTAEVTTELTIEVKYFKGGRLCF